MKPLILTTATRYMLPLLLLFSVYILLRGHNAPGGGFIGGLVAAGSFILYGMAFGVKEALQLLGVPPRILLGVGLLVALASGMPALLMGEPYLTSRHLWGTVRVPGLEGFTLGPPLFFDLGVYLVVIGVTLTVILTLQAEE
jgi:multicomponent Na+:H+ antiporter subunit B